MKPIKTQDTIYTDNGYESREDYLQCLSDDMGGRPRHGTNAS